jgi:hypothetical protein
VRHDDRSIRCSGGADERANDLRPRPRLVTEGDNDPPDRRIDLSDRGDADLE